MFENPRRSRQARNFTTNVPKILELKSSSEQIFFRKLSLGAPDECYKRPIHKQFAQVSGLCGPQFQSYLPKRFTNLCRALYGDAILVYRFGAPIWPPEINKRSGVYLFHKSSVFSSEN